MKQRLPIALSSAAFVLALFGVTPLGSAAGDAVSSGKELLTPAAKPKPKVIRGPRGPRGPVGPRGLTGPAGPAGPQGIAGPEGLQGPQGLQGLQGDRGPEGPPNPNAVNSDKLDGFDSLDFLRSNAAAGGDLTGTYPNPTVGPDKITGAEVAGNSLTGSDVDESTLAQVPSATSAVNAATAGNANALGGFGAAAYLRGKELSCISDIVEDGGPQCGTILDESGALRMSVVCDHDSSGIQGYRVWVRFNTHTNNAWIRAYGVDDSDFDTTEGHIQLQGTDDWRTFVYRSAAGVTVTGAYATWESGSTPNCHLHGFALIG